MKKFHLLLAFLFAVGAAASSTHAQPASTPDAFFINLSGFPSNPYRDTNSLSQTAQVIDITKTNLAIVVAGQSNIANVSPGTFSPVNASSLFQLNIYDGKFYPAVDPLLGASGGQPPIETFLGNPALRLADAIVTAGYFQRVYLVPIAIGSTAIADWATGPEAQLLPVVFLRMSEKGLVPRTNVTVIVIWGHGENDNSLKTSQSVYSAGLSTVIAQSRAAGFTGSWYIAKQTYVQGSTSPAVQAAQAAAPNGTTIFAGPNADPLAGNVCGPSANEACRQFDNLHWSDNGSYSYAAAWLSALVASGAPFNISRSCPSAE